MTICILQKHEGLKSSLHIWISRYIQIRRGYDRDTLESTKNYRDREVIRKKERQRQG
jgi:hypothetical protein